MPASAIFENAQRIISQVLSWFQTSGEDRVTNFITDTFQAGINNSTGLGEGFTIVPGSNNTALTPSISVTTGGIAYDSSGNRIFISPSDSQLYNPSAPSDTTNDGLGTLLPTPQSTGVVNIPLTQSSLNYLWIDYLATIDTSAFTLNKITQAKIFYKQTDGYNIRVTTVNTPPDASSIFLAVIDMTGGGAAQFANISQANRSYYSVLPNIVPIITPLNDGSDRTPIYDQGSRYTLDAHIKSVGTGTGISPTNPHNQSLADFGVSILDTVTVHRQLEHGNAIIAGTVVAPYPTASAMNSVINVVSPGSDYLSIKQLLSSEYAIVNGSAYSVFNIFGTVPSDAVIHFPVTPGSSGIYNVYWDSVVKAFGISLFDISSDVTKLWLSTVTWTLVGAFIITNVDDLTHLAVNSTTGMNIGDIIVQGGASTTISFIVDLTHIQVASTVGFVPGNALDTNEHNTLTSLVDRRRIGSTSEKLQRWLTTARPGSGATPPLSGEFGYNITDNLLEYWNGTSWTQVFPSAQVIQSTTSSIQINASSFFHDTTLSATITPSSTTSKIIVLVSQPNTADGGIVCQLKLVSSFSGDLQTFMGIFNNIGTVNGMGATTSFTYVDIPGTVTPITYKTQFKASIGGNGVSVNGDETTGYPAYMILIEVRE